MLEPEPAPLARAFDHVYLTADDRFWCLPSQARSREALRRVFAVSKSFRMPPRLNVATHPHVRPAEYATLAALAGTPDAEIEACLIDFHARHAQNPYPAALLDPAGRTGPWP
jgi:hypothetical protein